MEEKFIEIVKNYAVSDADIQENSVLLGDLGISSLGMFSMVCDLEEAYGTKISVMSLLNVTTVGQLYKKFVK